MAETRPPGTKSAPALTDGAIESRHIQFRVNFQKPAVAAARERPPVEERMPTSGIDGFLGTRASLMLDIVFVAMFVVIPLLGLSVYLVKFRRQYQLHKQMQLVLAAVLLLTVAAFEVDMRWHGWRDRARPSPYFGSEGSHGLVWTALYVHLAFAVSTAVLWTIVTVQACRHFPDPTRPNQHTAWHLRWGKLAALDMLMTAITGWIFYWLAFVAV
jgi:putative membrane protein